MTCRCNEDKQNMLERCVQICRDVGESFENCITMCPVAIKKIYGHRTAFHLGYQNLQFQAETEDSKKGWGIIVCAAIIAITLTILLL